MSAPDFKAGDRVHYTGPANCRGTVWDMTGIVLVVSAPTESEARYVVRRPYSKRSIYAEPARLRPLADDGVRQARGAGSDPRRTDQ